MLLTISQVAERLGVSTKTVRRLASRQELATVRPTPRVLRFDAREVDRFIAARSSEEAAS